MPARLCSATSPRGVRLRTWGYMRTVRLAAVALLLALVVGPPPVVPQPGSSEVAALLLIKQVLDPPGTVLKGWQPGRGAPCNWPGVVCDDSNRVKAIDIWERTIPSIRLTGRLPGAALLRRLPALTYIGLVETGGLSGTLPADWSQLPELQAVFLMGNSLTGPLPSSWGGLSKLRVVKLHMNRLSGPLPSNWSGMAGLEELVLGVNALTGPLPPSWGSLTKLQRCTLFRNKLNGSLPASWSGMASLTQMYLDTNALKGPVPAAWGDWPSIENVTLYDNPGLTGCLPAAWRGKVDTRYSENGIADVLTTGTGIKGFCGGGGGQGNATVTRALVLPGSAPEGTNSSSDEVAALLAIKRVIDPPGTALADWKPGAGAPCNWTGVVCEEGTQSVSRLVFWSNTDQQPLVKLSGKLPSGALLRRLPNLISIAWDSTGVSGTLPADWSQLTQLGAAGLSGNALEGTLPPSWGAMANLHVLSLFENQLNGTLPDTWSRLASLVEVDLSSNPGLTGPLPSNWSRLANLTDLRIANTSLAGSLPSSWSALTSLWRVELALNSLTGSLPPSWGALTKLQRILLQYNTLTGPLPATWSRMASLEALFLYNNTLTSSVPPSWGTLPRLVNVSLFNNPGLEGCLPRAWRGKVNNNTAVEGVEDVLTTNTGFTGFC